jgi:hypothetical protein
MWCLNLLGTCQIQRMRSTTVFRVAAVAAAIFLVFSGCSYISSVVGTGVYPPISFLLFYGALPILSLPICLAPARFGRWSIICLWGVFISIACTLARGLLSWCSPWWCGERSFWRVAEAQILTDHIFLGALILALLSQVQYVLRQDKNE